ncbi:hypothetical protein Tco_1200812 [Tanacetum coccineum]
MDLETTQNNVVAKLPLLKQGDYEMWKLRIEQYFQVQDYALWEVIEYGNSFKPVARIQQRSWFLTSTLTRIHITNEERAQKKKNDTLFEAIKARFGGNDATKKTQKTLLKQMYENFNAPSTESLDSIFNRLQKITSHVGILAEVKRSVTSSSNSSSQNVAFVSTPGSTNEDNTANVQDSTASTHVNTASTNNSTASLSDATVYAFLANQPNGSQVVHEDLEQIHEDDLEEMDLKWQLALLSLKARKFYQRTGKKIIINGSDTAGEDTSSKAMVAFDGAGFDWSFMADEEVPTNLALMAFSDSEYDSLRVEFNKSEFDLATYKRGLASVEEQLVFYKKNEKEKESNQIKIDNFENASKSLDKLIGSQIVDNSRKGVGFENYNVVPPPPTGLFAPPTIDLSSSGLKEFQQPEFEGYGVNVNKSVSENSSNEIKKTIGAPIIEDWVSDCDEDESEVMVYDNVQHKSEPKPEQAKQPRKINETLGITEQTGMKRKLKN